jgi:hypothetical protein
MTTLSDWKIGGAGRDRTDDLIVANSQPCARCSDTEEVKMTWIGSVHAGLLTIPFPARTRATRRESTRHGQGSEGYDTSYDTKSRDAFRLSRAALSRGC